MNTEQAKNYPFRICSKSSGILRQPGNGSVSLFEGVTDFLSLLVMQGKNRLPGDAIIMHSLSSHPRTVNNLKANPYSEIRTYLDNNQAGQKGTNRLKDDLGTAVISYSQSLAPYEDLNEALKSLRARGSSGISK